MHLSVVAVLCTLPAAVLSIPTSSHVVHEERLDAPHGWRRQTRLPQDSVLPVRIGLAQSNLDHAYDVLMDVSDPESKNYGNHWTDKQIIDFFAPSSESVNTVKSWLTSSGIPVEAISQSANRGWLEFEATVAEMEDLLKTKYFRYEHAMTGKAHLSCHQYSVPEHVTSHIDIITPTLHFDAQLPRTKAGIEKRDTIGGGMTTGPKIGKTITNNPSSFTNQFTGTSICNNYITPACLRALYKIPQGSLNLSSFGIVEYYPETYLQSDLNTFQGLGLTNDAGVPVGTAPLTQNIDGGSVPTTDEINDTGGAYLAESDLDLQYSMDLVYPQQVTLFQVGDNGTEHSGAISFNNFLDGIDGTYCKSDGGDTLGFDESFPDPDGYNHTEDCGVWTPTSVISTSYGYNEHDLSPAYAQRQCNEYMKLGLKGVSFIFSSGDNGVAGNSGSCIGANGYTNGSYGAFNPLFPGTCPYVTAVGATQYVNGTEQACQEVISSGGGFSNYFPLPSYQKSAVKSYFKSHAPPYTSAQYNNTQKTRAIPDVSAMGANYVVALDGHLALVYGTSAAAPTFASIITLINNERISKGKKALGFLNAALYGHPKIFNDITSGSNPGCGTEGFQAVPGWDPVTGLGTPNYTKMLSKLKGVAGS